MQDVQIVTTNKLAKELGVSKQLVLRNVQRGIWKPLLHLGSRPYRFDLEAVKALVLGNCSLTIESQKKAKITRPLPKKIKGTKERLWPK